MAEEPGEAWDVFECRTGKVRQPETDVIREIMHESPFVGYPVRIGRNVSGLFLVEGDITHQLPLISEY